MSRSDLSAWYYNNPEQYQVGLSQQQNQQFQTSLSQQQFWAASNLTTDAITTTDGTLTIGNQFTFKYCYNYKEQTFREQLQYEIDDWLNWGK